MGIYSVDKLVDEARRLAYEYRQATGKTLPITAEIAINDAIRLLGLNPAAKDEKGFDAMMSYRGKALRAQIKGRVIFDERRSGHRLGQLRIDQRWDVILLVIMDSKFAPEEIYLAYRNDIMDVIEKSKNKRGAMSMARFKIISELIWTAVNGIEDKGCWTNEG